MRRLMTLGPLVSSLEITCVFHLLEIPCFLLLVDEKKLSANVIYVLVLF